MKATPVSRKSEDKPPVPPPRPELEDCCNSGCNPCIFDIYEDAMERYRAELQAWEARHKRKKKEKPAAT
ncbi:MAG: oxidoreductase-like domain-containing protein [Pseudomonadota bacterium]